MEVKKPHSAGFTGDFAVPSELQLKMTEDAKLPGVWRHAVTAASDPTLWQSVVNWLGALPSGASIDRMEVVSVPGRFRMFCGQLEAIEKRASQTAFQPDFKLESDIDERQALLRRLDSLAANVKHNRNAKIVRVWHGTTGAVVPNLLSDGQ